MLGNIDLDYLSLSERNDTDKMTGEITVSLLSMMKKVRLWLRQHGDCRGH